MRKLVLALGLVSLALPLTAHAHFNLTMPPSIAKSTEGGKGDAPCGPDTQDKVANATITSVTGGSVLMLKIDETTPHPGFYRFAISTTTPPTFPADNVVLGPNDKVLLPTDKNVDSVKAVVPNPSVFPVFADGKFDHTTVNNPPVQSFPNATYPDQVIVPNLNCEKCTMQVIEFMAKHSTNGDSAGFFYHHCALLKITADPNKPLDPPGSAGGAGGASGSSGAAGAGGAPVSSAGSGGTGGASAGAGGVPPASAGAATAGAATAGAPPSAGGASSAGASTAGAPTSAAGSPSGAATDPGDSGGCSLSHRAAGSLPALSLLLGLFALGRRRSRRG